MHTYIYNTMYSHTCTLQHAQLSTVRVYCADWNKDPGGNLRKLWPEWDKNLNDNIKKKFHISDISEFLTVYCNGVCTGVVSQVFPNILRTLLNSTDWEIWNKDGFL